MKYTTASAFRTALEDRLNRAAVERDQNWLVRQRKLLAFDRLLARLLIVTPDGWLLKGAVALDLRFETWARATRDLDLSRKENEERATADLLRAQVLDLGDYFSFDVERTDGLDELTEGAAVRYRIRANLAGRRFEMFTLDVGFDSSDATPFDLLDGPDFLGFAGIPRTVIPTLSLEQHVAEKLHAYTKVYADDKPSSRAKDLVDLVLIRSTTPFVAQTLRTAIVRTFADRTIPGVPASLPAPPGNWALNYARMSEDIGLEPDLNAGHKLAAAFLDPILDGSAPDDAKWNPGRGTWTVPDVP